MPAVSLSLPLGRNTSYKNKLDAKRKKTYKDINWKRWSVIKELRTHNIEVLLKLFKRLTDNLHLANLGDGVKGWPRVVVRVLFWHHLKNVLQLFLHHKNIFSLLGEASNKKNCFFYFQSKNWDPSPLPLFWPPQFFLIRIFWIWQDPLPPPLIKKNGKKW